MSTTPSVSRKNSWVIFAILMLTGIIINISQLKIVPVQAEVSELLNIDLTKTALLTSIFTIAGIILSIPGTTLMRKLKVRQLLLCLMGCLLVGNLIGTFTSSFSVMFVSRVIEGISCALIVPVGLSCIVAIFDSKSAGLATGIFSVANPVANILVMNGALALVTATGTLQTLWWTISALAVICMVLTVIFVPTLASEQKAATEVPASAPGHAPQTSLVAAYKNGPLLLLCLSMFFLSFVLLGLVTCYPVIFQSYGLSVEMSNFYTSLSGLFGIPLGFICGALLSKIRKPFLLALVGSVGLVLVGLTVAHLGPATYVLSVLGCAIFAGGLGISTHFYLCPQLARKPEFVAQSNGLLNTAYYFGILLSTPVLTQLSNNATDWTVPSCLMGICGVASIVCLVLSLRLEKNNPASKIFSTAAAAPVPVAEQSPVQA